MAPVPPKSAVRLATPLNACFQLCVDADGLMDASRRARTRMHAYACVCVMLQAREKYAENAEKEQPAQVQRHLYDQTLTWIYDVLESALLNEFILSSHYDYILNLKYKEESPVSLDYFKVERLLGRGAFGEVCICYFACNAIACATLHWNGADCHVGATRRFLRQ